MRRVAIAIAGALAAAPVEVAASPDPPAPLPRIRTKLAPGGFRTRLSMRRPEPAAAPRAPTSSPPAITQTTATPPTAAPASPSPASATDAAARARAARRAATDRAARERARRAAASEPPQLTVPKASAQLTLGLVVDGAALDTRRIGDVELVGTTVAGARYDAQANYAAARAYGFGEAVLATRELLVPGVSAYLASQFQLAPSIPGRQYPILRAWDRADPIQLRTGWTEADGIFDRGLLQTLRVRGGRQYVYGPAVAHLDGLSVAWKTSRLRVGAYLGSRAPVWHDGRGNAPNGLIAGGELAVVLRRGASPVALRGRALTYEGATHSDLTLDWTARRDLVLALTSRAVGRSPARQHLTARYRWSEETRIVLDADLRHRADWLWDHELRTADDPTRPRRYLDLGPQLPRVDVRARAGTVLLDNIDLLVFGGLAYDARGDDPTPSYTSAGWVEGGGALEVRVRRTLAVSLSGMTRIYNRRDPDTPTTDVEDTPQRLRWPIVNTGERTMAEGGVMAKFSGGARRFSVSGEIYARRTRYVTPYADDAIESPALETPIEPVENHGGGRFLLEAWVSPDVRVRTEYDLSNRLSIAPETAGLKSLRMVVEGRF